MGGLGEGLGDFAFIAVVEVERDIIRRDVIEHRRAGADGAGKIGDGGQGLDVEDDRFRGVFCLQQCFRHDEGHGIADKAHLVHRERGPGRALQGRAVAVGRLGFALKQAVAAEIRARIDAEHSRHGARLRGLDRADHAMGMAAAHHHRIGLARQRDIVGVATLAA